MAKVEYALINGVELEYLLIKTSMSFTDIKGFIRSRETLRLWCNSTFNEPRRARAETVRKLASLIATKLHDNARDVFESITFEQSEEWSRCEYCGQPGKLKQSSGKTGSIEPHRIEAIRLLTCKLSMGKSFACVNQK